MWPAATTCRLSATTSYTRTRLPPAIAPSFVESGEKRSESIDCERITSRCDPAWSFCSTTVSMSDPPAGTVTNATHCPLGEIVGARPMPSRRGSFPLSFATKTTGLALPARLT